MPDVGTPTSLRESSGTPNRVRALPPDFRAKLAKRNSMPDPPVLQNLGDAVSSQMQKPQAVGYQSPSTASPMSAGFQFTPQMGNVHIPDLKNVMFPSDNPFAYPNPPMSALEAVDGQYSFSEPSMASNEPSVFGTPSNGNTQAPPPSSTTHLGYDFSFQQALNENPHLAQQIANHGRDFNAPFMDTFMQNAIGGNLDHMGGISQSQEPLGMGEMSASSNPTEYWNQVKTGSIGMRTGLTPGAHPSMDEYFGSEVWNPAWGEQPYTGVTGQPG